MLSAVITALLLSIMLLVVASLIMSALRERQRHMQTLTTQGQVESQSHPLDQHVTMILHMQNGVVVGVEQLQPMPAIPAFSLPASWYRRRRTLVSASFLLMLLLTLFAQSGLADGALQTLSQSFSFLSFSQSSDVKTVSQSQVYTASQLIERVDSANRNQYYNDYQYGVWSYSSCSGIAMEEVMNSYGKHLIAADVLQVEQNLGVWDSYNGLTGGEAGIAQAAAYFGFKASPNPPRTLQDLIRVTDKGFPVIVGIPGHILDVRGGDGTYVYLIDSAPANRKYMSHADFMGLWSSSQFFSVLLTPR